MNPESKRALIGFALLILIFGGGNLLLVGGQKLWHRQDRARLDALKNDLTSERKALEAQRRTVDDMSEELRSVEVEIATLRAQLDDIESSHPNGIPADVFEAYSESVNRHNALVERFNGLLSETKAAMSSHDQRVDTFNTRVNEANMLAEKTGGTWVLVPVPRGRSHK